MRRIVLLTAVLALAGLGPARAVEVEGLYKAQTIVTGTGEAERARGLRKGLEEVLVKLTGAAELAGAARIEPVLDEAASYLAAYEYEDRLKGIPIHDEQGTRDRPHFLRMSFDPGAVDRALAGLGLGKWRSDRPRLAVWLGIKTAARAEVLGAASDFGYGQREALLSAAAHQGVPVVLPALDAADRAALGYADIAAGERAQLRAASARYGAEAVLAGTLIFDGTAYWDMDWSLDWQGAVQSWRVTGVTFDEAMRTGIAGAARILSAAP